MAKYLFRARYTQAGVAGLLKEGGSSRREALRQTIEGMGAPCTISSMHSEIGTCSS